MNVQHTETLRPEYPILWLVSPGVQKETWEAALRPFGIKAEEFPLAEKLSFFVNGTYQWLQVRLPQPGVEYLRRGTFYALRKAEEVGWKTVQLAWVSADPEEHTSPYYQALGEMAYMSLYRFRKYAVESPLTVEEIFIHTPDEKALRAAEEGFIIGETVNMVRDWVNEPPNVLTAEELARRIVEVGQTAGFSVKVLDKAQIAAEKMGGLLAVNRGSQNPPTFTIAEYHPANPINRKPIVLVGKGIVFDTGGLSLKKTTDSMDYMKCDMAGAAVVIGVLRAAALLRLPFHLVALVPATDNRPGENAYTPNDIIYISDGTPVEILNTDAEGRLILADALVYARRYDPAFVIDFATLTGSAALATGRYGAVFFTNAGKDIREALIEAGFSTYERLVEFPLWEEYGDMIKSNIAAIKNSAGREAGAITAAKFLEYFVRYPWAHVDIAGTAYINQVAPEKGFPRQYQVKYATGFGVRLMIEFLRRHGEQLFG